MFGGTKQGGGGDEFVFLTGLFESKSGKSYTGGVKPEAFNTLFEQMQKADAAGTSLLFIVTPVTDGKGTAKARLSVVVGKPQADRGPAPAAKAAPAGPFGTPKQAAAPAASAPKTTAFGGVKANNPPADELNKFLEGFGN